MKLLMLILFFPFSFEGENGRELLDTALEKCSRLESLEACRDILYRYGVADRLPLSCPLKDKFRISSPYGGRIHPITGKHSLHSGVDMAVELAAPVHATASGTVVFAGRKGGYGRCVIIRHSYGFETLYAHLAALLYDGGQKARERGCYRLCREHGQKHRLSSAL